MESQEKFESWCIIEVMGHSRYAGFVSEQVIGGCSFVRVDVPASESGPAFTKMLGQSSIFAITPCTEATARAAVKSFRSRPFSMFELPMLAAPSDDDDEADEDEEGWR